VAQIDLQSIGVLHVIILAIPGTARSNLFRECRLRKLDLLHGSLFVNAVQVFPTKLGPIYASKSAPKFQVTRVGTAPIREVEGVRRLKALVLGEIRDI